ncbi:urease isoform X2 [Tanacetum coccineum]
MDVAYRFPLHKYRNEIKNINFRVEGYFHINIETGKNVETKHFTIGDDYGMSLNDLLTTIQGNNHRFGWIRFFVHMLEVGKPFSFLVRGFNAYINGVHDGRSMYEIGRPYDRNKFFVTRNFKGYGVMYRNLLGHRGEDNLVGVQIGYNILFHSAYTISTNKGKPRSWKKSIATFMIMYPEALSWVGYGGGDQSKGQGGNQGARRLGGGGQRRDQGRSSYVPAGGQ